MKIITNPDTELVREIDRQLEENLKEFGKRYCPCALALVDDNVCMCREFREQKTPGECHCGKYIKVAD